MPSKIALVTGSAQGIGRGVARALAARGWTPHVVVRPGSHGSDPDELAAEFGAERTHVADMTDGAAAGRLVADVLACSGRLDAVVHAVGPYETASLEASDVALFERMMHGNLYSALHLVAAARPAVRAASGSWLFFGCAGIDRWRARRVTTAYIAAKSALLVTMRGLALEEAPHGVRVNMVSPGFVPHEGAAPDTLDPELQAAIPLGRAAEMREVTDAATWLLSDEASHVVGQNLEVAGGWML